MGPAPVELEHNTAKDPRFSPISYDISCPVWILVVIPVLFVEEEAWKFAIRVILVEDHVTFGRYPRDEILVAA